MREPEYRPNANRWKSATGILLIINVAVFVGQGLMTELAKDVPVDHYLGLSIAGLVNTHGRTIQDRFGYGSDSNGYWRHTPLGEEITLARHPRLQVLTHPEWWVPEPMSPRARITRAIDGRAAYLAAKYDAAIAAVGRENR